MSYKPTRPALSGKKRKIEDGIRGKTERPLKRFRKQVEYHSSSDEDEDVSKPEEGDFAPVDLAAESDVDAGDSHGPTKQKKPPHQKQVVNPAEDETDNEDEAFSSDNSVADGDDVDGDDAEGGAATNGLRPRKKSKRNDPLAFSTSISKILSTKLPTSARADPVLSRSISAAQTARSLTDSKLEKRANAKLRHERKEALQRGRVTDVLGLSTGEAGEAAAEEKRLRKIAQRGVVKLFNAVRAAQVRGEEAAREERRKGTVGMEAREEKVRQVTREGFLELINGGRKESRAAT